MKNLLSHIKSFGLYRGVMTFERGLRTSINPDLLEGPGGEYLNLYGRIAVCIENSIVKLTYPHWVFCNTICCDYFSAVDWCDENNIKCKYITYLGKKAYKPRWGFKRKEDAVWFKTVFGGE